MKNREETSGKDMMKPCEGHPNLRGFRIVCLAVTQTRTCPHWSRLALKLGASRGGWGRRADVQI